MRWLVLLLLIGCEKSPKPDDSNPSDSDPVDSDPDESDPDDPDDPNPPEDPWAAALGGCIALGEEVDAALGLIATRRREYDSNGDIVLSEADYLDDESFYDWVVVNVYGAPHQIERSETRYPGSDVPGWTTWYTWEEGHLVRQGSDYDDDGDYDEIGAYLYEPGTDKLIRWEWDLDGDGVLDDTADFTWTPDGDGWRVNAEGIDPNGIYRTETRRDAQLRELDYHYEDSVGFTLDWSVASYSELGFTGDFDSISRQDGEVVEEESERVTFDALGREIEVVHEKAGYANGQLIGSFSRTLTITYDCP